jgi:hypothetical protein
MTRVNPFLLAATVIGLACAAALPAVAQQPTPEKPRAVIELFTSQGCSSCPPADKLMLELARDPTLIVLTMPVDYWDYLGWKDTLAHAAFTQRQKGYSAVRGDRQVYTPQAVINGAQHAVGSDRSLIDKAIGKTRMQAETLAVAISIEKSSTQLQARLPAGAPGASGQIWVMSVVKERHVQIGRGENSGRSMVYANVVRGMTRIGGWNGEAALVDIPAAAIAADAESVVVILQAGSEKKPGVILGAARRAGL